MKQVYLDYNATTPLLSEVEAAMRPFWSEDFGNASSVHRMGQKARFAVDEAREIIAQAVHCRPGDLVFTSGGTEANNLAIQGLARNKGRSGKDHGVTSTIEHPSVLDVCRHLEREGLKLSQVNAESHGVVNAAKFLEVIHESTGWASLMLINNETGAFQPVERVGRILKEKSVLFHSDCVQALGKVSIHLKSLPVDTASFSAHKLGGPKGVGALYIREGLSLGAMFHGGHQEKNIRPGTENPALIAGFARAVEIATANLKANQNHMLRLKHKLHDGIKAAIPGLRMNGSLGDTIHNTLNMSFGTLDGTAVMMNLDQKGIYVSTGSACAAGSAACTVGGFVAIVRS
jgi:cysteine desulfurase